MNHYAALRRGLEKRLPDGLILLSGGNPITRNFDVDFAFRQRSDFLYLTGVEEPGCLLLIDPAKRRHTLFMPRLDNHHRVWLGDVPDPKEAKSLYGIARVLYADRLESELRRARGRYRKVYADAEAYKRAGKILRLANRGAELRDALDELRAVKTSGEIELMRRASAVSGRAHMAAMRRARPGQFEYEVQAVFEAECLRAGLKHLAYPSIVAAGVNAAVLHYHANNSQLKDGDLLLIDAGAECGGYASDITRTFPVSGRFSGHQKEIYSIVLETQKKCIDRARPGVVSAELHLYSMTIIAEGLKSMGLLRGDTDGLVESGAVRLFYPHGLTHMLGLDVHDTTGGRKRRMANPTKVPVRFVARLEPGFVITMEPGIYFIKALLNDRPLRRKHRDSVDFAKAEQYLDFGGVRIEDDVVVQPDGPPLNLTSVPKEIDDVEALCER
ncbi:MAG: aminopeptidase P family protein [Elusimicrobia bacterium]|nr:aminopeptidase P family protein [Elusimicrobiota bacterium]